MRPLRLEVEGFTSFREKVVVDFAGLDLFAITGPTGSGKSSLLDAMVLALFGQVPRVSKEYRQLISHGAERMNVRFDFSVGDATFRIARAIRAAGAPQFRLERLEGERVIDVADRAAEVAAQVEEILGLDYDAFVRSVILPQGQFDALLKGKPEERRKILVALLNLDVYRRMLELANARASDARRRAELVAEELRGALQGATPARVALSREAAARAASDRQRLEAELLALFEALRLAQEVRVARAESEQWSAESKAESERLRRGEQALPAAAERFTRASLEKQEAEAALASLKLDRERHLRLVEARARLEQLQAAMTREAACRAERQAHAAEQVKRELESQGRAKALRQAETAVGAAQARLEQAEVAHDEARRRHLAHALRQTLRAGEPCPVCERAVEEIPGRAPSPMEGSEAERIEAKKRSEGAREALLAAGIAAERAHAELRRLEAERQRLDRDQAQIEAEVKEPRRVLAELLAQKALAEPEAALGAVCSELAALEQALTRRAALEAALRRGESELGSAAADKASAAAAVAEASSRLGDLEQRRSVATRRLHRAREALRRRAAREGWPELLAPSPEGDELSSLEERQRAAQQAAQQAAAREARLLVEAERFAEDAARAAGLVERKQQLEQEAALFGQLAQHLKADQFLAFVQEEALQILAEDASRHLFALSQGRYSLQWREQDFSVQDAWNADSVRSVKTLSGGESFLASLSLALALAERVAELSAEGRAGEALESLFLDEGFGSLDPEALDLVLSALDELQGGRRMVGVVTHVASVAERMPARIEVRRGENGSQLSVA